MVCTTVTKKTSQDFFLSSLLSRYSPSKLKDSKKWKISITVFHNKQLIKNPWIIVFNHISTHQFYAKIFEYDQTCEDLFPHLCRGLPEDLFDCGLNVYIAINSQI